MYQYIKSLHRCFTLLNRCSSSRSSHRSIDYGDCSSFFCAYPSNFASADGNDETTVVAAAAVALTVTIAVITRIKKLYLLSTYMVLGLHFKSINVVAANLETKTIFSNIFSARCVLLWTSTHTHTLLEANYIVSHEWKRKKRLNCRTHRKSIEIDRSSPSFRPF